MGWSDTWIHDTRAALIAMRGEGATSTTDAQTLPAMSGLDTVAIISQITPGVINACVRALGTSREQFAIDTGHIAEDGGGSGGSFLGEEYISAQDYFAGWPLTDTPYKRSPLSTTTADTWEIYYGNGEAALLSVCRQAVNEWQRLCNASAAGIAAGAANILGPMGTAEATEFWDAVGAITGTLDALNENPPVSTYDAVMGGLRAATTATEQFVGKSIADISEEVGKTAANVTEGFFREAGLLAVAVAGIALYLYVR